MLVNKLIFTKPHLLQFLKTLLVDEGLKFQLQKHFIILLPD